MRELAALAGEWALVSKLTAEIERRQLAEAEEREEQRLAAAGVPVLRRDRRQGGT